MPGERLQPGRRKPEQQPSQESCLGCNPVIVDGAVIVQICYSAFTVDTRSKYKIPKKSKMTLMAMKQVSTISSILFLYC